MENRESDIERLNPSIFGRMSARYYYLNQLTKQFRKVNALFLNNAEEKIMADYGCGNMPYQSIFRPRVQSYIGLDLADNKKADIIISPEGTIELTDASIDFVLSTQVLEHVENPNFYLSEANRILKKGGKLIISTHGYWMFHPDPTDYWRWTSTGLKKIISENGFEICYFEGILGRSSMGLQLFQDGILFKFPKPIRKIISLIFQPLIIFFDKIVSQKSRNEDACTYVVVATKV